MAVFTFKLRWQMNANRADGQAKFTVLRFLMQALVKVVPEVPQVNASYDGEAGILHWIEALHIGIASQTHNGLVVPVVHHAETLDIRGMAAELQRLAEAARSGHGKARGTDRLVDHHFRPRADGRHHVDAGDQRTGSRYRRREQDD